MSSITEEQLLLIKSVLELINASKEQRTLKPLRPHYTQNQKPDFTEIQILNHDVHFVKSTAQRLGEVGEMLDFMCSVHSRGVGWYDRNEYSYYICPPQHQASPTADVKLRDQINSKINSVSLEDIVVLVQYLRLLVQG
jgi:hypothetical protein